MPSDRIFAADSRGNVYVTDNSAGVSVWDGSSWTYLEFYDCVRFGGMVNRVAVDRNDRAWITWYSRIGHPYSNRTPGFNAIDAGCQSEDPLPPNGPIADIIATDTGLWMVGPGWLRSPQGSKWNLRMGRHIQRSPIFSMMLPANCGSIAANPRPIR